MRGLWAFHRIFCHTHRATIQGSEVAGVLLCRYTVHCGVRRHKRLGQSMSDVPPALRTKGDDVQEYSGYSVWHPDPRMPDFYNW